MRCDKCGKKFEINDLYCATCGSKKEDILKKRQRKILTITIIAVSIILIVVILLPIMREYIKEFIEEVLYDVAPPPSPLIK